MSDIDNTPLWDSRQLGASMEHAEVSKETLPPLVKCHDVMVDLETMGLPPTGAIVAIGAVCFDIKTGKLGETFYQVVDLETDVSNGANITPSTVMWWLTQSEEARAAITCEERIHIADALYKFRQFLEKAIPAVRNRKVWGNGAAFDNVMLRCAYERHGLQTPWYFTNDQDVRTMVRLGKAMGFDPKRDMPFEGERHHALADAIHQAKYVSAIYQKLGLSQWRGQTTATVSVDTPAFIKPE